MLRVCLLGSFCVSCLIFKFCLYLTSHVLSSPVPQVCMGLPLLPNVFQLCLIVYPSCVYKPCDPLLLGQINFSKNQSSVISLWVPHVWSCFSPWLLSLPLPLNCTFATAITINLLISWLKWNWLRTSLWVSSFPYPPEPVPDTRASKAATDHLMSDKHLRCGITQGARTNIIHKSCLCDQ